jgi:hypothetical protein
MFIGQAEIHPSVEGDFVKTVISSVVERSLQK